MKAKIKHIIALCELENGEQAAMLYGGADAAECFDYVMATAANGKTHVKHLGAPAKFVGLVTKEVRERMIAKHIADMDELLLACIGIDMDAKATQKE